MQERHSPHNLSEFVELAQSAGIQVMGFLSQRRKDRFFGSGKIRELKYKVEETQSNLVLFNGSLTPVQSRNLTQFLKVPVMERTQVILKIFSSRARSYEGRLQVELAQCLDELSRVRGAWLGSLSRQGGGYSARGPGEKAKEIDRRQIQKKIRRLRKKLEAVRKTRSQQRKRRYRNNTCNFALAGCTNAGKSTLFNRLSGAQAPVENHVFLTLDPMTRKVFIPNLSGAVLTDTVGFIQNLPPHLISAFKAALEESLFSDVLLHVIDVSAANMKEQIQVVNTLIQDLKWDHKPIIHVYNKIDKISNRSALNIPSHPFQCTVSAHSGEGVSHLLNEMKRAYFSLNHKKYIFDRMIV